jgi:hypothetical protein
MSIDLHRAKIDPLKMEKSLWLAEEIFRAFPESVTGLVFYVLDCGAFYDAEKGRVIGKREQITRFIRFLNQENLLHEYDLKYLV